MIEFEKKPSNEVVEHYCSKLEEFLQAHNLKIKVDLKSTSVEFSTWVDNNPPIVHRLWIDNITITDPVRGTFQIRMIPRIGIKEDISDNEIWRDAWEIQNDLYKEFKILPGAPDGNDPYWKLWCHLSKK